MAGERICFCVTSVGGNTCGSQVQWLIVTLMCACADGQAKKDAEPAEPEGVIDEADFCPAMCAALRPFAFKLFDLDKRGGLQPIPLLSHLLFQPILVLVWLLFRRSDTPKGRHCRGGQARLYRTAALVLCVGGRL